MANNRMFLCHKPSGKYVFIGKRMGLGWYGTPDDIVDKIKKLFDEVEKYEGNQDSFVIAMEGTDDNEPQVYTEWQHGMVGGEKLLLPTAHQNVIDE